MNGPSCMYTVRPLNKFDEEIKVPTCMYPMKNIQKSLFTNNCAMNETSTSLRLGLQQKNSNDSSHRSILEQNSLPEITDLEGRQEAVLKHLEELKQQMSLIKDILKDDHAVTTSALPTHTTNLKTSTKEASTQLDIVINANPRHPPYSLIALSNIWQQCLKLRISWHIHSSIQNIPKELEQMFTINEGTSTSQDTKPPVNVTLIWKNVERDAELVLSPSTTVIRGEVNILRFLGRRVPPRFNFDTSDIILGTTADAILDTCHSLFWTRAPRERQALVRTLDTNLKKSQYLLGENVTIVDIAAWSVLKQLSAQDMSGNLNKWYQQCSQKFTINVC